MIKDKKQQHHFYLSPGANIMSLSEVLYLFIILIYGTFHSVSTSFESDPKSFRGFGSSCILTEVVHTAADH